MSSGAISKGLAGRAVGQTKLVSNHSVTLWRTLRSRSPKRNSTSSFLFTLYSVPSSKPRNYVTSRCDLKPAYLEVAVGSAQIL